MNEEKIHIPKKKVTIKDPLLEPYFITWDIAAYVIKNHNNTQTYGYFSKIPNAIKEIIKLKNLDRHNKKTITLEQYIENIRLMQEEFYQKFDML